MKVIRELEKLTDDQLNSKVKVKNLETMNKELQEKLTGNKDDHLTSFTTDVGLYCTIFYSLLFLFLSSNLNYFFLFTSYSRW